MGHHTSRLIVSARAAARRAHASDWLLSRGRGERLVVVGPTREAASDLVREVARGLGDAPGRSQSGPAAFGWQRLSRVELASTLAAPALAKAALAPIGALSLEALCARLLHEEGERASELRAALAAAAAGSSEEGAVFDASLPGAARALAKTLGELRLAGVRPAQLEPVRPALARLLAALEQALARGGFADRADVLRLAADPLEASELCGRPLLWLDAPLDSLLEERLLAALAARAPVLALAPEGDDASIERLARALGANAERPALTGHGSLARMQRSLFGANHGAARAGEDSADARAAAPGADERALEDSLELFSAPGEGRECVEIARRILAAAGRGVPFDRMAVLLRQPGLYRPLLEEALARAGVPAFFARGTVRPDPAGRAFLSLLACADEGLSASRFAEYLSLGELPEAPVDPARLGWVPPASGAQEPGGELLAGAVERAALEAESAAHPLRDEAALPPAASWRWEPLLIDAAVIGGREVENAKERWARRLAGHREELVRREQALAAEDEAGALRMRRARDDLDALWSFAQPLLERLSAFPREATWGDWLPLLDALAGASLRSPERVRAHLAQLLPLAQVGPVSLGEVQLLLARELGELSQPPPAHREGRLFVAPIEAARGLSFSLVFAPGVAERLFPPKALQDPLLRDRERARLGAGLRVEEQRVSSERLQLRLAAGAAEDRLVLSWPRLELQMGRARVPSFYGLEALAAAEGTLPGFAELSRRAERAGDARAGWPAPRDPRQAIDAAEHDLALLGEALHRPETETRGLGRYLLGANPALRRALYRRAGRARRRWFSSDGLVDPSIEAREALQKHQLEARSFSASALQNYAACPYRFLLSAIHRLEPREEPHAIDELDPLSRGSLMHDIQFELFTELQKEGALPLFSPDARVAAERLARAQSRLEEIARIISARYRDDLAPAIARVWDDSVASILGDLREWLRRVAREARWMPLEFERAFGLVDRGARDAHSETKPVQLAGGLQLRGSIDLVERDAAGALRATDYKSGRQRAQPGVVIGGGAVLQPVLYALALEQLFPGARVEEGQLYYCTHAGDFAEIPVRLDTMARDAEKLLAGTVGGSLRDGFFPAAPRAGECARCDYLEICGEGEEARVGKKPQDRLFALHTLRGTP